MQEVAPPLPAPPPSPSPVVRRYGFLRRHWRGDFPLAVSWWINGLLVVLLAAAFFAYIQYGLVFDEMPKQAALTVLLMWICVSLAVVWWLLGVWRSASRYAMQNPNRYWNIPAKAAVLLVLGYFSNNFANVFVPQFPELLALMRGSGIGDRYTLRLSPDRTVLEVNGGMGFGLSDAVARVLQQAPGLKAIQLDSPGGRVAEARKLALLIVQQGLDTHTRLGCYSACILPFAAGQQRVLLGNAELGFHQYSFPAIPHSAFADQYERDRAFLLSRGVGAEFVERIFATPHTTLWRPTADELKQAGFVTAQPSGASGNID